MFWVWITIAAVSALIVVPYLVGFFLPERYEGSARRRFDWTPDEVWTAIHDAQRNPVTGKRCRGVASSDRDESSLPNWIEDLGSTKITITTVESEKPRRVVRHFQDSVVPMTADSVIEIEPDGDGAAVTVENTMTIKSGTWHVPIFRFMMTITGGTRRGCEDYLKNLEKAGE